MMGSHFSVRVDALLSITPAQGIQPAVLENSTEFLSCPKFKTTAKQNIDAVQQTCLCEPQHDKTNNMSVRPAKTQISLGIHPVW